MDLQLIIVIIIGIAVVAILLRSVYRFFFVKKEGGPCGSCTGCSVSRKWTEEEKADPYTSYLQ